MTILATLRGKHATRVPATPDEFTDSMLILAELTQALVDSDVRTHSVTLLDDSHEIRVITRDYDQFMRMLTGLRGRVIGVDDYGISKDNATVVAYPLRDPRWRIRCSHLVGERVPNVS